jgi:hypothetical protein
MVSADDIADPHDGHPAICYTFGHEGVQEFRQR